MGEPQRSDAIESDRRSSPRFPADLLGQASVRLLGGSEVTLINFSERGLLFQSETRLLVGARGTIRIVVGTDTTIAAGTVVRSLVQGMASGKLAFHTALALDQPLALAAAVEARERARIATGAPEAEAEADADDVEPIAPVEPVEPLPVDLEPAERIAVATDPPVAEAPVRRGKTIEKRSRKAASHTPEPLEARAAAATGAAVPESPAAPDDSPGAPVAPAIAESGGFGDPGFDSGSFGWSDPPAETVAAGLSVLFVSTSKERTSRLHGMLAGHRRDIVLTTVMHARAETIADIARQHDVLLFDFAIGPEALERTLTALRSSPLGASIAIFVPQQTELPPSVSSLANACVAETTSGNLLAAALRDAAWTPWQPIDVQDTAEPTRDDLFWKAFDALPVPVFVVDAEGRVLHANAPCAKLAGEPAAAGTPLAALFVAEDGPAIAALIADGLAGGYQDTPLVTTPAGGATVQVVLQALSVLPGQSGRPELALRCELRAEEAVSAPAVEGCDPATELAALTEAHDELSRMVDASRGELARLRDEIDESRGQIQTARRERDELRGLLEIAQRDLERARELERTGAAKILELERVVGEAARSEAAGARAQSQLAEAAAEAAALRAELDALRLRTTTQGAEAERAAVRYAAIETSARQATDELKSARADVLRLTRERDHALAAVDAERARADAAAAAVRDDTKKSRRILTDDAAALTTAKLLRQIEDLRAEVKQEQDARRELEELLDQNAANLEQTIQDYEERLEALGAGVEDARAMKPKRTRQG